ncbi:MAG TPA: gliding motility protein GldM [Bacteroidia bacterium]|jgi:gliding motility-associated protein GldM|nr:gliding motility protein GldM [Bacteroidia bacterium]
MSLPKEPRQKMINIMYLVLTALLALNVSKQIVHAFVVVNTGLQKTNANTITQNKALLDKFDDAFSKDPKGSIDFKNAAHSVHDQADAMVKYIQDMKADLIKAVDKPKWTLDKADTMLEYVDAKEDFTTPTGIMCGEGDDVSKGKAHELKMKLGEFRKNMLTWFSNKAVSHGLKDTANVKLGLLTPAQYAPDEGRQTWEYYYFGEAPLVSDVVTFTKLQADVRSAESAMLNYFYSNIGSNDVKVSTFKGKILPASTYVLVGDSFKADIFPTAVMKTLPPQIEVGDSNVNVKDPKTEGVQVKVGEDGIGKYAIKTDKEGPQKIYGLIRIPDPQTGAPVAYPFSTSYIVAKAAVTVAPSQMNVFYAGVDNPVDISAAGFDNSALHPSMSYGSISPSGAHGHYVVRATADAIGKDAMITVSATMPDGTHKSLPAQHFRIKRIPDPATYTAGKSVGPISKAQLQAIPKIEAKMPADFDFAGVTFNVVSFTMAVQSASGIWQNETGTGGRFTPKMLTLINQTPRGGYIIIQDVFVMGPDGRKRPISGMSIKVN